MPHRSLTLCILALLLAACAGPDESRFSSVVPQALQTGHYQQHRIIEDGWRIRRLVDRYRVTCFAVKPAPDQPDPEVDTGLGVPFGGAGFYMMAREGGARPVFGFYGRHPYDRISTAERNGTEIADVDDQDRVLGWEGETLRFRVNTLARSGATETAEDQRGELDFTGVREAFTALVDCLTIRHRSEPSMIDRGED